MQTTTSARKSAQTSKTRKIDWFMMTLYAIGLIGFGLIVFMFIMILS